MNSIRQHRTYALVLKNRMAFIGPIHRLKAAIYRESGYIGQSLAYIVKVLFFVQNLFSARRRNEVPYGAVLTATIVLYLRYVTLNEGCKSLLDC